MTRAEDDPHWRLWWRRFFAAFLVLALVIGLYLSFRPAGFEDEPELAQDEAPTEQTEAPPDDARADEQPTDEGNDEGRGADEGEQEDEELTEEEAEELIAAARDPENTTVQVLDAGGGSSATSEAADALRDMGYDVVAINSSRTDYATTTVLFTDGNQPEAEALPARDDRFAQTAPNERLSDGVDLHVVVGSDWSG